MDPKLLSGSVLTPTVRLERVINRKQLKILNSEDFHAATKVSESTCSFCGVLGSVSTKLLDIETDKLTQSLITKLQNSLTYCLPCGSVIDRLNHLSKTRKNIELELKEIVVRVKSEQEIKVEGPALYFPASDKIDIDYPLKDEIHSEPCIPASEAQKPNKVSRVDWRLRERELLSKCYFCLRKLRSLNILEAHFRTHTNERTKQYKCYFCKAPFPYLSRLDRHINSHTKERSLDPKPYKCYFCLKHFTIVPQLEAHLATHTKETIREKCHLCSKSYSRQILNTHLRMVHGTKEEKEKRKIMQSKLWLNNNYLVCYFCGIKFSSKFSLQTHMRHVHTKEVLLHQCSKCFKTFKDKPNLAGHIKYTCSPTISKHERKGRVNVNCYFCKKFIAWRTPLQRHMNFHTREGIIHCKICRKFFFKEESFKRHNHASCGNEGQDKRFTQDGVVVKFVNGRKRETGNCGKCGKYTVVLSRHEASCGIDLNARKFCKLCGIFFKHIREKLVHDRTEHKPQVFRHICYFCSVQCKRKSALETHMSKHTLEKRLQCDKGNCRERFSNYDHLRFHERVEHGCKTKPYNHAAAK